jgi:hypothetical protein
MTRFEQQETATDGSVSLEVLGLMTESIGSLVTRTASLEEVVVKFGSILTSLHEQVAGMTGEMDSVARDINSLRSAIAALGIAESPKPVLSSPAFSF